MTTTFVDQVAARAQTVNVVRVLLGIIASPFYALGIVAGIMWVVLVWAYAAVQVGWSDARARAKRTAPSET